MSQNWLNDPKSGDYTMNGGSPVQTDSLQVPAYYRLRIPRDGWMYAPDSKYGSLLHTLKKRQTTKDSTQIETMAATALQPMADDGRAKQIDVQTVEVQRAAVGLKTVIIKANGKLDTLVLPTLGV